MSSLQWTFLGIGLGALALGAGARRWTQAWERWGIEGDFGLQGSGVVMCIVGVAFLIGIAMIGVGSFTLCVLESYQGLAELVADALWLGIAIWLLVEGVVEHNSGELAAATFMFSIAGLLGLLTFVFHWEHLWVKPVTDFCDCF